MDSTTDPHSEQADTRLFLIRDRASLSTYLRGCDHAQTLVAAEMPSGTEIVIALGCKQWSCRWCADKKIRDLARKVRLAQPNKLLTLTIDPKLWDSPRAAFDGTRRKVSDLFQCLRQKFGEIEYLRVTELTKAGWPHYHLLIRSGFLPHACVRDEWARLTGATIVDIRRTDKYFKAYWYLVKYLAKLHRIEWTERHVSYSRAFFLAEEGENPNRLELERTQTIATHPVEWLLANAAGAQLDRINDHTWRICRGPTPDNPTDF